MNLNIRSDTYENFISCAAGMSTSLLVTKMKDEAKKKELDCEIWAVSVSQFKNEIDKCDIVLLGPQVKYELDNFKPLAEEKGKKIAVINMMDYGMMNGKKVLEAALNL